MKSVVLVCCLYFAFAVSSAQGHSLESLEKQLGSTEKYFQSIDKKAPEFSLQDADGNTVRLSDMRGKVVVLNFVYTSCPDVCPLHSERISEIQGMINSSPMRDLVQFVTITTDPKTDTPEIMREFGAINGLDPQNWMFLTSGQDRLEDTRALVEQFGHKFSSEGEGYLVHSVVTHNIDREGRWRANFHGLKFQPTNLVVFVNALTNAAHGPDHAEEPNLWQKLKNLF